MKKTLFAFHFLSLLVLSLIMVSCFGGKLTHASQGGEVTGRSTGKGFNEPTPYGMTLINRGFLHMGVEKKDTLWGMSVPTTTVFSAPVWQTLPMVVMRHT